MTKYSQADVVQAKRELAVACEELSRIKEATRNAQREYASLMIKISQMQEEHDAKEKHIEVSLAQNVRSLEDRKSVLVLHKKKLEEDAQSLGKVLSFIKREIVTKQSDTRTPLLSSIESKLSESIKELANTKRKIELEIDTIASRKEVAEESLSQKEDKVAQIDKELEIKIDEVELKKEEIQNLQASLDRAQQELESIKKRENDLLIKEQRILPEYQRIYFSQRKN